MALLKEDSAFTHVIAIDFGTGASGYSSRLIDLLISLQLWYSSKILGSRWQTKD